MKKNLYNSDGRLKEEVRNIDNEFEDICLKFLKKHKKYKISELQTLMTQASWSAYMNKVLGF